VTAILKKADVSKVIRTDIYDLAPIERWYQDRVVLLGDAAHATTPNLGQGGCQAVEDAYVLAKDLTDMSIAEAFRSYQDTRFAKANYVVKTSWQLGQITNTTRALIGLRNFALRSTPASFSRKTVDALFSLNY
jgi:2-polyprenyl-6-methoxyphenol hydroxylase-like FAD-dependent oxidoreductase